MSGHPVGSLAWEREQALARQAAKTHGLRLRARAMRVLERRWNATPAELEEAIGQEFPWMEGRADGERAELLAHALELQVTERRTIRLEDLDVTPPACERLDTPKRPARARPEPKPVIDEPEPEEMGMEHTKQEEAVEETPESLPELGNMSRVDPKLRTKILAVITEHLREHPGTTPAGVVLLISRRFRYAITKPQATYLLGKAEAEIRDAARDARAGSPREDAPAAPTPPPAEPETTVSEIHIPAPEPTSEPRLRPRRPRPTATAAVAEAAASTSSPGGELAPTAEEAPAPAPQDPRLPRLRLESSSEFTSFGGWDLKLKLQGLTRSEVRQIEQIIDGFLGSRGMADVGSFAEMG